MPPGSGRALPGVQLGGGARHARRLPRGRHRWRTCGGRSGYVVTRVPTGGAVSEEWSDVRGTYAELLAEIGSATPELGLPTAREWCGGRDFLGVVDNELRRSSTETSARTTSAGAMEWPSRSSIGITRRWMILPSTSRRSSASTVPGTWPISLPPICFSVRCGIGRRSRCRSPPPPTGWATLRCGATRWATSARGSQQARCTIPPARGRSHDTTGLGRGPSRDATGLGRGIRS